MCLAMLCLFCRSLDLCALPKDRLGVGSGRFLPFPSVPPFFPFPFVLRRFTLLVGSLWRLLYTPSAPLNFVFRVRKGFLRAPGTCLASFSARWLSVWKGFAVRVVPGL